MVVLIKNIEVSKSILRHHYLMAFLFGFIWTLCLILVVTFFSTTYAMSQNKEETQNMNINQERQELNKNSSQEEVVSYVGVIQKTEGVSIAMAGRYELVDGERRVCLLISRHINLDAYINHKVKVTGMPKVAVEGGSSVLMVIKVEPLN